jgi:hypothetical protein
MLEFAALKFRDIVKYRDPFEMEDIIVRLSSVNYCLNSEGWTPLHIAAKNGRERVVFHLLAAGANTKIKDYKGRIARELSLLPTIRRLLENDDWLQSSRYVVTGKGEGMISGSKLRDFYTRKMAENTKECIGTKWGGLLAGSGIQPEDFDSFRFHETPREASGVWKERERLVTY